ncbi:hypothetical protein TNCV_679451 [Trichonephila clavipes]|nr:hypothetical protein TNCV_679451 [Trichonephila clavipes]
MQADNLAKEARNSLQLSNSFTLADADAIARRKLISHPAKKHFILNLKCNHSLVYADKQQTLDHLEDNIRRVIVDIRPQMLDKVNENWTSRLDYIRASCGSPLPEIIFKM